MSDGERNYEKWRQMSVAEKIANMMWRLALANMDNDEPLSDGTLTAALHAEFPDATEVEKRAAYDIFAAQLAREERLHLECDKVELETGLTWDRNTTSLLDFLRRAAGTGNRRAFETLRRYIPTSVYLES